MLLKPWWIVYTRCRTNTVNFGQNFAIKEQLLMNRSWLYVDLAHWYLEGVNIWGSLVTQQIAAGR